MLLNRWLPEFNVSKRHSIAIPAAPERVWEELLRYEFSTSAVTRLLMTLRGYGWRLSAKGDSLVDGLERFGFTLLEEHAGEELVFGIVGKFWRPDGGLRRTTPEEFAAFREPGFAKAAWNLKLGSGLHLPHCELSTETRVLCLGEDARRKFLLYWRVIEPFSGAIRRSLLRGIRRAATSSALT